MGKYPFFLIALFFAGPLLAYDGPIVDAHSQIDCEPSAELVKNRLMESGIRHVLLAARPCPKNLYGGLQTIRKLKSLEPDLVSVLSSTKLNNHTFDDINQTSNAVGVGEIILQHSPLQAQGINFQGYSRRIQNDRMLREVRERGFPAILHVEISDFKHLAEETLKDLEELLLLNPNHPYVLIHMGQFSAEIAKKFLSKHKNLYFMTSMTTPIRLNPVNRALERGTIIQSGWVSLFDRNEWRSEWKELVIRYPDNFILALDNVFKSNWENHHVKNVRFWRNALNELPNVAAKKLACENANRLWSLQIRC